MLDYQTIWVKIAALLVLVSIGAILAVMLFKEQPRFRLLTLAGTLVWLPLILFIPISSHFKTEEARMLLESLMNLLLGASLAGALGLLLKDRQKIFWLIAAGAILYPLVDTIERSYPEIAYWCRLVSGLVIANTNEQLFLSYILQAALTGLMFGLPLALIFMLLQKGKPPALPEQKQPVSA
jgi:hypothetical protein